MEERIYLNVPYSEKDEAKALGAKFDWDKKLWYFYGENKREKFKRWIRNDGGNSNGSNSISRNSSNKTVDNTPDDTPKGHTNEVVYLNVPFSEKDEVKKLGAKFDWGKKMWYFIGDRNNNKFAKWIRDVPNIDDIHLSDEQQELITLAKQGKNVLVDACIGSGKTTAIQKLCNEFPNKNILYVTYNMLLKKDAQEKIKNKNVLVTNYHGFASKMLSMANIPTGHSDSIQIYLRAINRLNIPKYDMLVLDEYQDIELEIAKLLESIKKINPDMQIIAVGDMEQKIYDKTTLDVPSFIKRFLGDFVTLNFTQCFRLNESHAKMLGTIWNKKIVGVNNKCEVQQMEYYKVIDFLSKQKPGDILCLGSRNGGMAYVLNKLEERYPEKFNKQTVYASIRDEDRNNLAISNGNAIFTTYDSSKGLERKICVIFDFVESFWTMRIKFPDVKYEILRNIFCVAASRGKEKIIFIKGDTPLLTEKTLAHAPRNKQIEYNQPFSISSMFSFKYKEDIEDCFRLVDKTLIKMEDTSEIEIESNDGLIDLSPCIGILQEARFFDNYNIDYDISLSMEMTKLPWVSKETIKDDASLEDKVLYLTAMETNYKRYISQVKSPFVSEQDLNRICDRLATVLSPRDEVQRPCGKEYRDRMKRTTIEIKGRMDVVKRDTVFELKFVSELEHEHFLQLATYLAMTRYERGVLWNVRNNKMYAVSVPDKRKFMKQVIRTITKGNLMCEV